MLDAVYINQRVRLYPPRLTRIGHAPQNFPFDGASRVANKSSCEPIKDAHDDDLYPRSRRACLHVYVDICVYVCRVV